MGNVLSVKRNRVCCCCFILFFQMGMWWQEGSGGSREKTNALLCPWSAWHVRKYTAKVVDGRGDYSPRWEPGNNTRSWREQKSLRTQGICIKGGFGRLVEVRKLSTKDVATTKGRRMTTRAAPKAFTDENEEEKCSGFGSQRIELGGFRVCYVSKSQGKKASLHLQCSELAQLPNLCRVNLWDVVIIQDKVKESWRKRT